jgi:cytochrome P450
MTELAGPGALGELLGSSAYKDLCQFQVADPYPILDLLREEDPVHWSPELEAWLVTRFDLVQEGLRAPALVNDRTAINMRAIPEALWPDYRSLELHVSNWLGFTDPPKHARMREIGRRILSPAVVKQQLPKIRSLVQCRVDELQDERSFDLLRGLALPLPLTIISDILGVPSEDMARFHRWSTEIAGFAGIMNPVPGDPVMRLVVQRANEAWGEAEEYFTALLSARAEAPRQDGISTLAEARKAGQLTTDEALGLCVFLLAAGHGTTTALISNGILVLLMHRAATEQLQRAPELAATAVEEILRYEGPIATASRLAAGDVRLGDRLITEGEAVILHLGGADRDPRSFDNPGYFDVARSPNRHVAFGWGKHLCLGAPLARLQATAVLDGLAHENVLDRWELEGPPRWRLGQADARELEELRVSWSDK